MVAFTIFLPLFFLPLPLLFIFLRKNLFFTRKTTPNLPRSYPIIGSYFAVRSPPENELQRMTEMLKSSPSSTLVFQEPLYLGEYIVTANPANVEHVLKAKFAVYPKGEDFTSTLGDFLGAGIINVDGDEWKFQRQVASHEFSNKSLRKFVEQVVDTELNERFIPIIAQSADTRTTIDLQDMLRRFAFDNICQIAFGYDPALLQRSLPESRFATAFENAVSISSDRFRSFLPIKWRTKRFLNIGSERRLRRAVSEVRDFAAQIVKQKKQQMNHQRHNFSAESDSNLDLLSRFLRLGHSDDRLVTDIVISFILAGRDTTSAAMTWLFWLLYKNPAAEREIVDEIRRGDANPKKSAYDGAKELVYTHAALHEAMRLYPPVTVDHKQFAGGEDVWPDGTAVRRGATVAYHVYAMGRMEGIWGKDWAEFKPERWLEEREEGEGRRRRRVFVAKDPYSFPVFQAGPRICLGKEMALQQMKRVVSAILRRFRVVPAEEEGFEPVLLPALTARMKGGFPVRFERMVSVLSEETKY